MKTQFLLASLILTLVLTLTIPLAGAKPTAAQAQIRNAKVVKEIKDVSKWMAELKTKPNIQMSLYPSCPDGRNCFIITEKTGDFCCEQDAHGCKSWQTCKFYEGKCSGGVTVMGDRYECTVCSDSIDKPAEIKTM